MILVTNNPQVKTKYEDKMTVIFVDGGYGDVLVKVRDMVYQGHELLTHPLMGSVKPNETPYRSIAVRKALTSIDEESVLLIEKAIETFEKFAKVTRPDRGINASEQMKSDFRTIDLSLISSALDR